MMLITNYLWIAKILVVLVLVGALGIQTQRVKTLKTELVQSKAQVEQCIGVNKTEEQTIAQLKSELSKNTQLCEKRVALKDKTINKIDKIRNLKGGTNDKAADQGALEQRSGVEDGSSIGSGDDILDMLNGLFNATDNSTNEVH